VQTTGTAGGYDCVFGGFGRGKAVGREKVGMMSDHSEETAEMSEMGEKGNFGSKRGKIVVLHEFGCRKCRER
jgi:hypothetical protein